VCCTAWDWDALNASVVPALDSVGLVPGSGVDVMLLDRGDHGRVLIFEDAALARRAALAIAKQSASQVDVFEVVGSAGEKRNRFRVAAWTATAAGELKSAEGEEVDLEDPEGWTGDLDEQTHEVLDAYAGFEYGAVKHDRKSFKKRKVGAASTPRVANLLDALQKARAHEAVVQADGRFELRIELAAGGKQRSFCSAAEYDELKKLLGI